MVMTRKKFRSQYRENMLPISVRERFRRRLTLADSSAVASGIDSGKLCRNPFSTIKLAHEHGGTKAIRRGSKGGAPKFSEGILSTKTYFGFVAALTRAVYPENAGTA
jgi:hypothetical protein